MDKVEPFSRFLLPVDTVEAFERVVPLAGRLINALGVASGRIDLLHVIAGSFLTKRFQALDLAAGQVVSPDELARLRADYLAGTVVPLLDRCSIMIKQVTGGKTPTRQIRDGDPVKTITALCAEQRYSTLIMGRRRLTGGSSRLTGSVTAGLVHRLSGATVYLVGDEPQQPAASPFARCLIGIDDSPASRNAVIEASLLLPKVAAQTEQIMLVHVLDQSCYYNEEGIPCSQSGLTGQRALEQAATLLTKAGVDPRIITPVIHFGRPGTVLVEEALTCDATMIFIGKRDRSRMAQLYLGSVCTDIVQNCRQRVLVMVG